MSSHVLSLEVIPDKDDVACADVWLQIQVAGRPVPFILDSGARRSQITADQTEGMLPIVSGDASRTVFGQRDDDLISVPSLTVGDLQVQDLVMTQVDPDAPGARNLLGLDVLGQHSCRLDLTAGTLTLNAAPGSARVMPLFLGPAGHAYLDVALGGRTAAAVWDTGAGITVVDETFIAQNPESFTETEPTTGMDASGATAETRTYLMSGARIGGEPFAAHKVAAVDLSTANASLANPMDMILGYTTLRQATWHMDFPQRQWSLTRTAR
jgi:predicted aspartyl protease